MTTLTFGSDELIQAFVLRAFGPDLIGADFVVRTIKKRLDRLPLEDMPDAWAELRAKALGIGSTRRLEALGLNFTPAPTVECPPVPDPSDRPAVVAYCDWEGGQPWAMTVGVITRNPIGGGYVMGPAPKKPGGKFTAWDVIMLRQRDGDLCRICDRPIDFDIHDHNDPEACTIDHVWASDAGGDHEPYNWRLAHRRCNSKKGARFSRDFENPDYVGGRFKDGTDACAQGLHCMHYVWVGEGPVRHATERFCHCPVQLTAGLA